MADAAASVGGGVDVVGVVVGAELGAASAGTVGVEAASVGQSVPSVPSIVPHMQLVLVLPGGETGNGFS